MHKAGSFPFVVIPCLLLVAKATWSKQMAAIHLGRTNALPRLLRPIWDLTRIISSAGRACGDHMKEIAAVRVLSDTAIGQLDDRTSRCLLSKAGPNPASQAKQGESAGLYHVRAVVPGVCI